MGVTWFWKEWKITCQNGMELYCVREITDGLSKCCCAVQKKNKEKGKAQNKV